MPDKPDYADSRAGAGAGRLGFRLQIGNEGAESGRILQIVALRHYPNCTDVCDERLPHDFLPTRTYVLGAWGHN